MTAQRTDILRRQLRGSGSWFGKTCAAFTAADLLLLAAASGRVSGVPGPAALPLGDAGRYAILQCSSVYGHIAVQ